MTCARCGTAFEVRSGPGRPRRYCLDCKPREVRATPQVFPSAVRTCVQCRCEFSPGSRRLLCDSCLPVVGGLTCRVRDRPKARRLQAGICAECGEHWVAVKAVRDQRFCSDVCMRRAVRRSYRQRHRRVRRHAVAAGEMIVPRVVFERDGWVCRLCEAPLDREAVVPAPLAPTLDHILPLALGGEHRYVNVQAAHFMCNATKRDTITQLSFAA